METSSRYLLPVLGQRGEVYYLPFMSDNVPLFEDPNISSGTQHFHTILSIAKLKKS